MKVPAIHTAEPTSQASACAHGSVWNGPRRNRPRPSAMMNQMLSRYAATNRCTPYFTASPPSKVTTKAASTTHPHAPPPMANPSAVSSAPATANPASRTTRFAYSPPGSTSTTNSAPKIALRKYLRSWGSTPTMISRPSTTAKMAPLTRLNPCHLTLNTSASWLTTHLSTRWPRPGNSPHTAAPDGGTGQRHRTGTAAPPAAGQTRAPHPGTANPASHSRPSTPPAFPHQTRQASYPARDKGPHTGPERGVR